MFRKYVRYLSQLHGKKTGLNGSVSDFSVGYKTFDTSNGINIYKYLMKNSIENNV